MDDAAAAPGLAIADCVELETRDDAVFIIQRQYLAKQWVVCIAMAHAGDEAPRHPKRELRWGGKIAGQ